MWFCEHVKNKKFIERVLYTTIGHVMYGSYLAV